MDLLINIVPFIIFMSLGYFLISKMGGGASNKAFEFSKNRARLEGNIKSKVCGMLLDVMKKSKKWKS